MIKLFVFPKVCFSTGYKCIKCTLYCRIYLENNSNVIIKAADNLKFITYKK